MVDGSYSISSDAYNQIIAKESELVEAVGGRIPHSNTLRRALQGVRHIERSEWCRSADDLAEHLKNTHQQICASFKPARGLKYFSQRSRNAKLMGYGDQAALAVVIVLVDLLPTAYLRESYRIGAYLADEANTAISNRAVQDEAVQPSTNSKEGSRR